MHGAIENWLDIRVELIKLEIMFHQPDSKRFTLENRNINPSSDSKFGDIEKGILSLESLSRIKIKKL